MTGYLTVGLIVGLGGYWVLLLACRTRDQGVVVRLTFADRVARLALAILETQRQIVRAFLPALREVTRAFTAWAETFAKTVERAEDEASVGLPDDLHAEFDTAPLYRPPEAA